MATLIVFFTYTKRNTNDPMINSITAVDKKKAPNEKYRSYVMNNPFDPQYYKFINKLTNA